MLTILSDNIKALIAENKTSIKRVAEAIGISTQSLSRYVNGHSLPDAEILIRIANHFNVSVDWLLGRYSNGKEFLIRRGQWIIYGGELCCSCCHKLAPVETQKDGFWYYDRILYCPNCGAKMYKE